jgi:hypothetical protein
MRAISLMRVSGWQWYRRDGTCAAIVRALVSREWKVLELRRYRLDHFVNRLEMQAISQLV